MRLNRNSSTRRTVAFVAATTASLAILTAPASSATGSPQATHAQSHNAATTAVAARSTQIPANVQFVRTRTSLLGAHQWYRQVKDGHFVVGGYYARHIDTSGRVTVWDGRRRVGTVAATTPAVSRQSAQATAAQAANASPAEVNDSSLMVLPTARGTNQSRLVWAVSTATGEGAATTYVDAVTGNVLKTETWSKKSPSQANTTVTGAGQVFDPNPVVKLQDESLRDMRDSADAVPATAYTAVALRRLDGSHTLSGRWAQITNADIASSATNEYFYNRANNKFEQVNSYYSVDAVQAYLRSLGFTDVNAESQKVETNAFPDDNSYYDPNTDMISLGTGGVDDAEDPEVIWHEYGHAVQDDQVLGFGKSKEAGAIGEGFGDYLTVTMSQATAPDTAVTPTACVMDWDATSYTSKVPHCLRRTDANKTYPADLTGEVHQDGKIWSRALWDMNLDLGRDTATTIIVEAQFWMDPKTDMPTAAHITVSTARRLYGDTVAATTRQAFVRRGIL